MVEFEVLFAIWIDSRHHNYSFCVVFPSCSTKNLQPMNSDSEIHEVEKLDAGIAANSCNGRSREGWLRTPNPCPSSGFFF